MLFLRQVLATDELEISQIISEFKNSDPHFEFTVLYPEGMAFSNYVKKLEAWSKGKELDPGKVPHTFFLAIVDNVIVGRVSIRHTLNDYLKVINGHIGYGIRPKFRKKGYAKEILRQALEFCKGLGLEKVMLTCDDDNLASIRTIESQGGFLEEKFIYEDSLKRRYWIGISY